MRRALLVEAEMPTWGSGNRVATSNPTDEHVGVQFIAPSDGTPPSNVSPDNDTPTNDTFDNDINDSSTPTFPQDNPWLTVTEEETGTKPHLLSRLWQSHVQREEQADPQRQEQTDPQRRYLIAATSSGMTDDVGTSVLTLKFSADDHDTDR